MNPPIQTHAYDLRDSLSKNRLTSFWRMMTGFRTLYITAVVTLAVAALAQTASFLLIGYFVDHVLFADNLLEQLPIIALGFIGLALIQGLFSAISGRAASRTAEGLALRLRNFMYDHIQRLSFSYHDRMQTGELLQRATSDVDAVRRFFADQAIGIGRVVLLVSINFIAMLTLNARLAVLAVAVVPLVLALSIFFFKRVSDRYQKLQEQEAKVSTTLQENLTAVRVVKAFARQDFERDKFEAENFAQFQRGWNFMKMHSLFWPVTDMLVGTQVAILMVAAGSMAIRGEITIGVFLAFLSLIWRILDPIRNLGRLIADMSSGLVSYTRVMEIIREEREILDKGTFAPTGDLRGEVRFENMSFAYKQGETVLHDITFHVRAGQRIALLGSTGSGKTTLMGLLPRFYDYTSGKLTIDGVDVREYSKHYLRRQIGIVQQEPFLFSRTIRENITYGVGRQVTDAEVEAAARAAAVHEVILSFPNGYSTLVGERGVTLSGGQKQRVTLARTLLKNPRILILDDATSSVDAETEDDIRHALQKLMGGRTTFIIAHKIQTVMHADMILVMDEGRIIQSGTHDQLIEQDGVYRQVYDLQSRIEDELEKEIARVG